MRGQALERLPDGRAVCAARLIDRHREQADEVVGRADCGLRGDSKRRIGAEVLHGAAGKAGAILTAGACEAERLRHIELDLVQSLPAQPGEAPAADAPVAEERSQIPVAMEAIALTRVAPSGSLATSRIASAPISSSVR